MPNRAKKDQMPEKPFKCQQAIPQITKPSFFQQVGRPADLRSSCRSDFGDRSLDDTASRTAARGLI